MIQPRLFPPSKYVGHIRIKHDATYNSFDDRSVMLSYDIDKVVAHFQKEFEGQPLEIQREYPFKHKKYGWRSKSVRVFESELAYQIRTEQSVHPDPYGFLRDLEGIE